MTDPAFFPPVPSPAVQIENQGVVGADQFNTFLSTVVNLDQLRTFPGIHNMMCLVQGTNEAGDGGATIYWYDMFNVSMDNNSSVIRPTGTVQGRWIKSGALQFQHPHTISADSGVFTLTGSPATLNVPGKFTFILFDDTCNLYQSSNGGSVWSGTASPAPLLGDLWTDLIIPLNDSEYSIFVAVDGTEGVVSIADFSTYSTAPTPSFSSPASPGNPNTAMTCAATSNGHTILIPIVYFSGTTPHYPQLSTNFGATFSDVTGLPANTVWAAATFAQNASVAYILPESGFMYKSTDLVTWTQLSSGPNGVNVPSTGLDGTNRLRCSANGNVVALLDNFNGIFWLSTDGGVTWPTQTSINAAEMLDFGMTTDGSKFLMTGGSGSTKTAINTNNGNPASWTFLSSPAGITCNLDPLTGTNMILAAQGVMGTCHVQISTDGGVTWTPQAFSLNVGTTIANWTACYVVP